jgi:hypothetical protein
VELRVFGHKRREMLAVSILHTWRTILMSGLRLHCA